MCHYFVGFFSFLNVILELKANFTVRRHILLFYFFIAIDWSYEERERREERKEEEDERQEEREKESGEVDERIEERAEEGTEEGTQETEERLELTEEACEEEERCEEDLESHSAAKRARVCSTFTDSQETAIVEHVSMTDRRRRLFGQKFLQN